MVVRKKDQGLAWCILALSSLSHMAHIGFSFAVLGNLTIAHNKLFNTSLQETNNIGSVHHAVFFITG